MLKIAIIACALCTGAGATVVLVKADPGSAATPAVTAGASFQDMHADAHLDNLPVRNVER
jgi:hypothetical protein